MKNRRYSDLQVLFCDNFEVGLCWFVAKDRQFEKGNLLICQRNNASFIQNAEKVYFQNFQHEFLQIFRRFIV